MYVCMKRGCSITQYIWKWHVIYGMLCSCVLNIWFIVLQCLLTLAKAFYAARNMWFRNLMRFCCLLVPRTTGTNYSCLLPSLQILVCRIAHRFRPEVLSTAMECYRFVVAIRGGYRWSLHRRKSKIFEDPFSAAQDLSKEIGVPLKFLRASGTKPIPRPKRERRFALHYRRSKALC